MGRFGSYNHKATIACKEGSSIYSSKLLMIYYLIFYYILFKYLITVHKNIWQLHERSIVLNFSLTWKIGHTLTQATWYHHKASPILKPLRKTQEGQATEHLHGVEIWRWAKTGGGKDRGACRNLVSHLCHKMGTMHK